MGDMPIGDVARRTGLPPSTLRYYEKAGLLRAPARRSKQRRYDPAVLGRIRMIQIARAAGFTIQETKTFISGFPDGTAPSTRWQALAARKRQELDQLIDGARKMRAVLDQNFRCGCPTIDACERALATKRR